MVRYPWPLEITYYQGGDFRGHEFKNNSIEQEYGIKTKPYYFGNPHKNVNIEILHQVLGNVVRTYNLHEKNVYYADPSS